MRCRNVSRNRSQSAAALTDNYTTIIDDLSFEMYHNDKWVTLSVDDKNRRQKGRVISAYTSREIGGIMKSAPQRPLARKVNPSLIVIAAIGPITYWLWNLEVACYATIIVALMSIAVDHQRRRNRDK